MIDLTFNNSTNDSNFNESFFTKIIEVGVNAMKITSNISLSINLVEEKKIQKLNKKYRNINKITDILSFPMVNGDLKKIVATGYKLQATIDLGDIFMCLPFAKKQSKLENINIDMKLAQLSVHGFLHLLGYDHDKSEKDAKEMFKLEKQILSKWQNHT